MNVHRRWRWWWKGQRRSTGKESSFARCFAFLTRRGNKENCSCFRCEDDEADEDEADEDEAHHVARESSATLKGDLFLGDGRGEEGDRGGEGEEGEDEEEETRKTDSDERDLF